MITCHGFECTRPTLLLYNISLCSHRCLAGGRLWSEGDSSAKVSTLGERDPGIESGGGCHPGILPATHTHVHFCLFVIERTLTYIPTKNGQFTKVLLMNNCNKIVNKRLQKQKVLVCNSITTVVPLFDP